MRRALVVLLAVVVTLAGIPAASAKAPLEYDTRTDTITVELRGKVKVRVWYRDYGRLGVKPVRVCVWDVPAITADTYTVTFRYNGFERVRLGQFDNDRRCKRIPDGQSFRTRQRTWDAYGTATAFRIGWTDLFRDRFHVFGTMR